VWTKEKIGEKKTNVHSPSLFDLPRFHRNGSGGTGIGAFNVKVVVVVRHGIHKEIKN
jgi:hypothetical protein